MLKIGSPGLVGIVQHDIAAEPTNESRFFDALLARFVLDVLALEIRQVSLKPLEHLLF